MYLIAVEEFLKYHDYLNIYSLEDTEKNFKDVLYFKEFTVLDKETI